MEKGNTTISKAKKRMSASEKKEEGLKDFLLEGITEEQNSIGRVALNEAVNYVGKFAKLFVKYGKGLEPFIVIVKQKIADVLIRTKNHKDHGGNATAAVREQMKEIWKEVGKKIRFVGKSKKK